MSLYHHILVGLDLSEDSETILRKAEQLAIAHNAKISVLHVIEPLSFAYAGDLPIDLADTQEVLQNHAKHSLTELTKNLTLKPKFCGVILGPTAGELRQQAESLGADLIAVGTHGRHGFAILLGSTASDVLHGTPCDVLALKI